MNRLIVLLSLLCFSFASQAARNDVLIVTNNNSSDSLQVGEYYAQKRDIDLANIAHVNVTIDYYIKWDQFVVLRDQIIKHIQDNHLQQGQVPVVCSNTDSPYYCSESVDQIRNNSTIKYLVMTKGVPTRLFVGDATTQPTSLDSFLRYWLVNYFDAPNQSFNAIKKRAQAFGDGRGMRVVDPGVDNELIIGRIDGVDLASAKGLVDKAIDAENDGVYGKLYGSQYGNTQGIARWWNYANNEDIYGKSGSDTVEGVNAWRYQHGLLGALSTSDGNNSVRHTELSECLTHIDQASNLAAGKSPQNCVIKLTDGGDPAPARSSASRQALADNSLVYLGSLDGQPTTGSFNGFLNWRRDSQCGVTLCENAVDPASCRTASTDPFKEINTECVGVADGFIGYNFQSYPVAFFNVWPTSWYQSISTATDGWENGHGDVAHLSLPVVRNDVGSDDSYSLWHMNSAETVNESCYVDSTSLSSTPSGECRHDAKITITNKTTFSPVAVNQTMPQTYQLSFKYRAININQNTKLRVRLLVHEESFDDGSIVISSKNQINYGLNDAVTLAQGNTPASGSGWETAIVQFTLNPDLHVHPQKLFSGLKICLESNLLFEGDIGIDEVVLNELGSSTNMIVNGSFNEGHKSVSAGDHAPNFLSRLNGVGFWGSVSHYATGGHSFDKHPMETLIYFMRGLPLGDAVWFAEWYPSGILYGDPLYSPVSVRFDYFADYPNDYVDLQRVEIRGDAVNGLGVDVTTSYSIEYCAGNDFYDCDLTNSWQSTGLLGAGGQRNQLLGVWTPTGLAMGNYVLRLSVTSQNLTKITSQTFYDYYNIVLFDASADYDSDGLTNSDELNRGTDMFDMDSDGDGLSDYQEVITYNTDPLDADTDGDQLNDADEVNQYGTDPNNADTDGDGFYDGAEVLVGMDPLIDDTVGNIWIGTITGRVTAADGEGVAGLTFWDILKYPEIITTDEHGYYVARGYMNGDFVWLNTNSTSSSGFSLSPSGWGSSYPIFTHTGGAIVARNFIATQVNGSISGKVTLVNGDPLAGIAFWDELKYPETVTTNADGRFVSQGYSQGDEFSFYVMGTNSGYSLAPSGWTGQSLEHDGSAMTDFNYVATQDNGTISGRITTPDGKPVPDLSFWDIMKFPATVTVTTTADGRYIMKNYEVDDWVWFNMYSVSTDYNLVPSNWNGGMFQHDGSAMTGYDFIAVPKNTSEWMGTITGRVTTADGEGVAGLTFWDAMKYPEIITTDEHGYYVAHGYIGGELVWLNTLSISISSSGFSLSSSGWDGRYFVHTGGAIVARNFIATQVNGSISGKVTLVNGDPLAGIAFWDELKYPETVTTNADGRFVSQGYSQGDEFSFYVMGTNSGYSLAPSGWTGQSLEHDGSAMTDFNYVATQDNGTISGRITTPDGKPVPDLSFWDIMKFPATVTVTTTADGRYIMKNYEVDDWVWFNMYSVSTDYNLMPSNWNGGMFQHDGSAMTGYDFVAVPQ